MNEKITALNELLGTLPEDKVIRIEGLIEGLIIGLAIRDSA